MSWKKDDAKKAIRDIIQAACNPKSFDDVQEIQTRQENSHQHEC